MTATAPAWRERALAPLLYLCGGLALALAWVHPRYDAFAWVALVCIAVAVGRARRTVGVLFGTWFAGGLARYLGLPWLVDMNRVALDHGDLQATLTAVGQCAAASMSVAVSVALASALTRQLPIKGRPLPVALWFPAAWLFGEYGTLQFVGVSNEAWLTTLWTFEPALRMLAHLGWSPTVLVLIFACSAVAQAIVDRDPRWTAAAVLPALGLALPPPADDGADRLAGVAAVHVADDVTLPHTAPPGEDLELVLWPEDTRQYRPFIKEGGNPGAQVPPPLPGSSAVHLMGLITRSRLEGWQNQLVAVAPDGRVLGSRAKRLLMLLGERRLMGVGSVDFAPGRLTTVMEVAGRRVTALICGELFSRGLVGEGVAAGGEVLLVAARDHIMVGERARRHMLAVQVLRSVEFGVPSVRASLGGRASFVAADGRVLAQSALDRNGFLTWDPVRGARDVDFFGRPIGGPLDAVVGAGKPPAPDTVVLYSEDARHHRTACLEGYCRYFVLEDLVAAGGDVVCPGGSASTVIVAGHGEPPTWLSHGPAEIATAARCFDPDVVVVDTCLGASSELLAAFGDLDAIVVAASTLVPAHGLRYPPAFYHATDPAERAAAVQLDHGELLRWQIDQAELGALLAQVASMSPSELAARQARVDPPLLALPLGASGTVLVPVDPERVRGHLPDVVKRVRVRGPRSGPAGSGRTTLERRER